MGLPDETKFGPFTSHKARVVCHRDLDKVILAEI